jgi:hypothetical protein
MSNNDNPVIVNTYGTNAPDAAKFGVGATVPDQNSNSCQSGPLSA